MNCTKDELNPKTYHILFQAQTNTLNWDGEKGIQTSTQTASSARMKTLKTFYYIVLHCNISTSYLHGSMCQNWYVGDTGMEQSQRGSGRIIWEMLVIKIGWMMKRMKMFKKDLSCLKEEEKHYSVLEVAKCSILNCFGHWQKGKKLNDTRFMKKKLMLWVWEEGLLWNGRIVLEYLRKREGGG